MEINVKAQVGNLEVIGDGTVHVNMEQKLNLVIGGILDMEFEFLQDKNNKGFRTNSKVEGNKWIWELTNYNNTLGTGVITPIEIGTLRARKLYVSFWIWTPDEGIGRRIINYVVYLEKEA
jgi:hypothetical protein